LGVLILLIFLGVIVGIGVGVFGVVHKVTTSGPAAASASIGQVAKDGDFAFVVKNVTCGSDADAIVSTQADETIPPGAQECLVTLSVTADKGSPQTFSTDAQHAYDPAGKEFDADENAGLYSLANGDGEQVNPGVTITAVVPFQISATDSLASVELHDSLLSGGVVVKIPSTTTQGSTPAAGP
jgi:hypothetical protein